MGWVTGLGVYVVVWWITLFIVLPWGNAPVDEADVKRGQAASAPRRPRLPIKMAINTVLAGVVWAIIYVVVTYELVSVRPS